MVAIVLGDEVIDEQARPLILGIVANDTQLHVVFRQRQHLHAAPFRYEGIMVGVVQHQRICHRQRMLVGVEHEASLGSLAVVFRPL